MSATIRTRGSDIWFPFRFSTEALIDALSDSFARGNEPIRLRGLPFRVYCFRHPDLISQIYTHKEVGTTKRPAMLPKVRWIMRSGTFIHKGGSDWKKKRLVLQPAFTRAASTRFANMTPHVAERLYQRWDASADAGEPIELLKELNLFIVDLAFKSLFSHDLDKDLYEVAESTRYLLEVFGQFWPVWLPTPGNARFRRTARRLQEIVSEIVQKRRQSRRQPDDILTVMLNSVDENGKSWSDDEIQDEIFSIYLGATIMAVVLTWEFCALSEHQQQRQKLESEIDSVLGGATPTCADLERLRYPQMMFKETTRFYPPVWAIPRFAYTPVQIGDTKIPGRSLLLPICYLAQRHPDFWDRPEDFDIERFAPEKSGKIHPFAYYPFGGGPRRCLGSNLAPLVCQLATIGIVQRYQLDVQTRFAGDPEIEFDFEVRPKDGILVNLTRRTVTAAKGTAAAYATFPVPLGAEVQQV